MTEQWTESKSSKEADRPKALVDPVQHKTQAAFCLLCLQNTASLRNRSCFSRSLFLSFSSSSLAVVFLDWLKRQAREERSKFLPSVHSLSSLAHWLLLFCAKCHQQNNHALLPHQLAAFLSSLLLVLLWFIFLLTCRTIFDYLDLFDFVSVWRVSRDCAKACRVCWIHKRNSRCQNSCLDPENNNTNMSLTNVLMKLVWKGYCSIYHYVLAVDLVGSFEEQIGLLCNHWLDLSNSTLHFSLLAFLCPPLFFLWIGTTLCFRRQLHRSSGSFVSTPYLCSCSSKFWIRMERSSRPCRTYGSGQCWTSAVPISCSSFSSKFGITDTPRPLVRFFLSCTACALCCSSLYCFLRELDTRLTSIPEQFMLELRDSILTHHRFPHFRLHLHLPVNQLTAVYLFRLLPFFSQSLQILDLNISFLPCAPRMQLPEPEGDNRDFPVYDDSVLSDISSCKFLVGLPFLTQLNVCMSGILLLSDWTIDLMDLRLLKYCLFFHLSNI